MSDIFISYARQDRFIAGELAYVLSHEGWSVWWDSELLPGQAFNSVIEQELKNARCVVAIWSSHSVKSRWVRSEAAEGADRDLLVPVIIEDVVPPLGLREAQCADLRKWDGTLSHEGCAALMRAVRVKAGKPKPAGVTELTRKVCLVGASGVGKTSLVRRYVSSIFSDKYLSTIGVKIDRKAVVVAETQVQLIIWDIEGHDEFRSMQLHYMKGMNGYFVVVDGTRQETLERAIEIDQLVRDVSQVPPPRIALLNKADLTDKWAVDARSLQMMTDMGWDCRVVSAKIDRGVNDAFHALSEMMLTSAWSFQDLRTVEIDLDFDDDEREARLLRAALSRQRNAFLAWARLAGILAVRNKRELADKAVLRARRSTPNTPDAWIALAEEFIRIDRTREAVDLLERAIAQLSQVDSTTRLSLASTYARLGSGRKALQQYQLWLSENRGESMRGEIENRVNELKRLTEPGQDQE